MRGLLFFWLGIMFWTCTNDLNEAVGAMSQPGSKVVRYLALGDSYTIGTAIGVESSYATLMGDSLLSSNTIDSLYTRVIAKNGWTTKNLLDGIELEKPDSNFDVVSLLIGVNNQYQGLSLDNYKLEFSELVNKAIVFAGGDRNKVLVISIPDWGVSPAGAENRTVIAQEIDAFNAAQKSICDSLQIDFMNITTLSRKALQNPTYIAADGLHFSAQMHLLWNRKLLFNSWSRKF